MTRTPTEIIQDHLSRRLAGDVEGDIESNYSPDVVILQRTGILRGHDGVRNSARQLAEAIGDAQFAYRVTLIEDDYGYLYWTAESGSVMVDDGADSFVVRDDRIVMQTIHFSAREAQGHSV